MTARPSQDTEALVMFVAAPCASPGQAPPKVLNSSFVNCDRERVSSQITSDTMIRNSALLSSGNSSSNWATCAASQLLRVLLVAEGD